MSAIDAGPRVSSEYAFGGLTLAWVLYVPYFFVPVTGPQPWGAPDSTVTGTGLLVVCFLAPPLWHVAFGHLLYWSGSVLLVKRRWHRAAVAAVLSLAVSLVLPLSFFPTYVGMYCQLLAVTVLGLSATIAGVAEAKGSGGGGSLETKRLRRDSAILLALALAYLLWGPFNKVIKGTIATEFTGGLHVTRWGVLGFTVVTTNASYLPPSHDVQFSGPMFACTLLLSAPCAWLVVWLWRRGWGQLAAG